MSGAELQDFTGFLGRTSARFRRVLRLDSRIQWTSIQDHSIVPSYSVASRFTSLRPSVRIVLSPCVCVLVLYYIYYAVSSMTVRSDIESSLAHFVVPSASCVHSVSCLCRLLLSRVRFGSNFVRPSVGSSVLARHRDGAFSERFWIVFVGWNVCLDVVGALRVAPVSAQCKRLLLEKSIASV
ncbi:hypothetical protein KFK09_017578 [Dendrobium nobile]|uniref:Transmembrane protein n=1 Tax=Dendrobium nobile TaxID=94219 RepID=A0A8T3B1N3_DENNO|nr:hypothetical protein KFK09_017578 [Dendrobium nobile]